MLMHCEAMERGGYEVCRAHNLMQLREHLDAGRCEIIIIGPGIPAPEKIRIGHYVIQHAAECKMVEIYDSSPQLSMAHAHVHKAGGAAAVLEVLLTSYPAAA